MTRTFEELVDDKRGMIQRWPDRPHFQLDHLLKARERTDEGTLIRRFCDAWIVAAITERYERED